MTDEDIAFLNNLRAYISTHPTVAAHVSDHVAAGINDALHRAQERAADIEVALAVCVAKRYDQRDELILAKLEKWNGKTSLNWDSTIRELKNRGKK